MKVTDVKICEKDNLKDYDEVFSVHVNKERKDKQAIMINPKIDSDIILLSASRLNQVIAKSLGIPYEKYLALLKNSYNFTQKYENLNLTEEQLMKIIEKEQKGF